MVRRARVLLFGGALDDQTVHDLGRRTGAAVTAARAVGQVRFDAGAREAWGRLYPSLSEGRPGLLGAITARAEAQTVRLALLYAALDGRPEISFAHLRAAVAIWNTPRRRRNTSGAMRSAVSSPIRS